jgi:hypothetical protein
MEQKDDNGDGENDRRPNPSRRQWQIRAEAAFMTLSVVGTKR